MALLNKLFFPSSASSPSASAWASSVSPSSSSTKQSGHDQAVHSKNYLSQFPFDGGQVRVLVYRESDSQGRRLLFDSNALQKVPLKESNGKFVKHDKKHSNFIEVCEDYGYKHNRPSSADITSIGEMVFGALAMSFRGTALKVHWLHEPSRILCSQVFLTPIPNGQSPYSTISMNSLATPRTSISSEHGSIDGHSMSSFSMPFSVSVERHMSLTASDRISMSTCPLDVPDKQSLSANSDSVRADTYSTVTDSGYSGISRSQPSSDQWSASYQYSARSSLGSVMSDQSEPLRKFSIDSTFFPMSPLLDNFTSDNSLQRRISRNLRTSFENEHAMNDLIGFISDHSVIGTTSATNGGSEGGSMGMPNYRRASYCANESRSNPEIGKRRDNMSTLKLTARRAKLGLAVCITMSESFEEDMELFCSEHIALLESMLSRLRACTERAYIRHKDFLQIMYNAWQETQQWFNDLFTAPRIRCPVWLSITTSGSKYSKSVAERFIKELCWLLSFADTKDTNFFISTVLTAILTHHLGWVSTIASVAAIEQRAKLLQVSQKHPYNALWAQMGDLYGAVGLPPKLTRTIVYGTEKLSVERLLNILTYFIRCDEVRRSAKREDFNKDLIDSIICQNDSEIIKKSAFANSNRFGGGLKKSQGSGGGGGLTRTQTCKQNLNTISDSYEQQSSSEEEPDDIELVQTEKKNEIPNVLAFRDSRFVQQELRIGNYLMDTGIEKKSLLRHQAKQQSKNGKEGPVRVILTSPDNVEMCVDDGNNSSIGDGAVEAIDLDASDCSCPNAALAADTGVGSKKNFFWNMGPAPVKEGLSLANVDSTETTIEGRKLERRSSSFSNQSDSSGEEQTQKRLSHLSLSDLITQNSMGKSDRMTWGIEPIKENVSLEEQKHFEISQKQIERDHGIYRNKDSGVVFLLGDNEPLVNLKKSNEDLTANDIPLEKKPSGYQSLCPQHQRTAHLKKHSGVKFNFEQFPEIATNYMRSKNLVVSNYELLMDKCKKLEAQETCLPSTFPMNTLTETSVERVTAAKDCIACNSILSSYQTPSNATEVEYETDDQHYPSITCASGRTLHTISSAASIDTLKPSTNEAGNIGSSAEPSCSTTLTNPAEVQQAPPAVTTNTAKRNTYSGNSRKISSHRGSISSVAAKCAALNETVHLLKLPVPGIKELPQDDEPPGDMKLRAGFSPSLFLNISDHYVPDVVLQGTSAPPSKWEINLRDDLALATRSASLISLPAENVAIVADMDKWDVQLISSQSKSFPGPRDKSAPVGMSQLVSSMLETVHAMSNAGISAYECLSFLESKMQEIYLHSESLAAFLMETDICTLNVVTNTLNLSQNDVPLLYSIATIHTPQIVKKCGISFR